MTNIFYILCLQTNSAVFYDLMSNIKGLLPVKPFGAMYMMIKIDLDSFPDFESDITFTERLMSEESVFCLPASVRDAMIRPVNIYAEI